MTRVLGRPDPLPYIDENDLLDLAADLGVGWFPASRLYDWHRMIVVDEYRRPVVGKSKFGRALREAGWQSQPRYLDGRMVRCWFINKPWNRRGLEKLAKEKAEAAS